MRCYSRLCSPPVAREGIELVMDKPQWLTHLTWTFGSKENKYLNPWPCQSEYVLASMCTLPCVAFCRLMREFYLQPGSLAVPGSFENHCDDVLGTWEDWKGYIAFIYRSIIMIAWHTQFEVGQHYSYYVCISVFVKFECTSILTCMVILAN